MDTTSRRNFLRTAPMAAAAVVALPETMMAQGGASPTPFPFKVLTASDLATHEAELKAKPGNYDFSLSAQFPFSCVLTVEEKKAGKEFEWHEGRDHIFQILDGETRYELGGTPVGAHSSKPSEWNAPSSTGFKTVTLKKGDVLLVPRNTLHRRITEGRVMFFLFSTEGAMKA